MIRALVVGMVLRLPSGNTVRLISRDRLEWVCVYTEHAERRGEVVFSGSFLRRVCTVC